MHALDESLLPIVPDCRFDDTFSMHEKLLSTQIEIAAHVDQKGLGISYLLQCEIRFEHLRRKSVKNSVKTVPNIGVELKASRPLPWLKNTGYTPGSTLTLPVPPAAKYTGPNAGPFSSPLFIVTKTSCGAAEVTSNPHSSETPDIQQHENGLTPVFSDFLHNRSTRSSANLTSSCSFRTTSTLAPSANGSCRSFSRRICFSCSDSHEDINVMNSIAHKKEPILDFPQNGIRKEKN